VVDGFMRWLRTPLSPFARAVVILVGITMLVAAMRERRWDQVGVFIYTGVFTCIIVRFVWQPLTSRRRANRTY
jgi:hypothetical protein